MIELHQLMNNQKGSILSIILASKSNHLNHSMLTELCRVNSAFLVVFEPENAFHRAGMCE